MPTLPIDPAEAVSIRCRHALMVATKLRALASLGSFDLRSVRDRQRLASLYRSEFGKELHLPADATGVRYLVDFRGTPLLLPEGDAVLATALTAALATGGPEAAAQLAYSDGII